MDKDTNTSNTTEEDRMNIEKHLDGTYSVDGIPGRYRATQIGSYYRIHYHPTWGGCGTTGQSVFIGSVSVGNYGSPGVTAKINVDAETDIAEKILRHAKGMRK